MTELKTVITVQIPKYNSFKQTLLENIFYVNYLIIICLAHTNNVFVIKTYGGSKALPCPHKKEVQVIKLCIEGKLETGFQ